MDEGPAAGQENEGPEPDDGLGHLPDSPDGDRTDGAGAPAGADEPGDLERPGEEAAAPRTGLPPDLRDIPLPGAREFLLAILILENGVRRVADLDQRELADAVNSSPQDVRNAFRDLRAEGVVSVSEDDWATLHLSASAWRRLAVAFADAVWSLAPHVSWPPTYLTAAVLKALGKVP